MVAKFGNVLKSIKISAVKNSPAILLGVGIVGFFSAMVLVGKETPKALAKIDEKKKELDTDKLKPVEIVKATWVCYIPAAVTAGMSVVCILGSNRINARRYAALSAAYGLTEAAFKDYREKAVEVIGERKDKEIKDRIAKDKIDNHPMDEKDIIITGKGNYLCFDSISGRAFRSDIDYVKKAQNRFNERLLTEMFMTLNEWYGILDIPKLPDIDIGKEIGWKLEDGLLDLCFSSQLTEDGEPCLVIGYNLLPRYNYRD